VVSTDGLLGHKLVYVAPFPPLARLERLDDRMRGLVEVLGGVLVFGTIAAAYVSAGKA
jgi:hypothetical protein